MENYYKQQKLILVMVVTIVILVGLVCGLLLELEMKDNLLAEQLRMHEQQKNIVLKELTVDELVDDKIVVTLTDTLEEIRVFGGINHDGTQ